MMSERCIPPQLHESPLHPHNANEMGAKLLEQAWFKIGDLRVTRKRSTGPALKPDFGWQFIVCGWPAGLGGSNSLGLRHAEAQ
jgi:hypothetical protein